MKGLDSLSFASSIADPLVALAWFVGVFDLLGDLGAKLKEPSDNMQQAW